MCVWVGDLSIQHRLLAPARAFRFPDTGFLLLCVHAQDRMGPAKYWPDYEGCIHPGVLPANESSGAMILMEEFYNQYWSSQLNC